MSVFIHSTLHRIIGITIFVNILTPNVCTDFVVIYIVYDSCFLFTWLSTAYYTFNFGINFSSLKDN